MNPKIFMYYDYAVSSLGYRQDMGDFISDCIEDFFRSRGYRVVIQHESEVPNAFTGYGQARKDETWPPRGQ